MVLMSMFTVTMLYCTQIVVWLCGVVCLLQKLLKIQLYFATFFFTHTYEKSSGITYFNEKINAHVAIINNSHCPVWWQVLRLSVNDGR